MVGPFRTAWGCCVDGNGLLGDVRPGDVRLLFNELVGDRQFTIDELFATTALDDVVDRLLVMEVNIVLCSLAEPADVLCWLLPMAAIAVDALIAIELFVLLFVIVVIASAAAETLLDTIVCCCCCCWVEIDWLID